MNDFVLPFKGLSTGNHRFTFEIDDTFFKSFDYFESETGNLQVVLDLIKEATLMDLHFRLSGKIYLTCDRCLGRLEIDLQGDFRLIVKIGETYDEESEEVITIPNTESRIDLKQYVFESINLMLPIQRVHPDISNCDPDMIDRLESMKASEADPRWDKLKNIKLKD